MATADGNRLEKIYVVSLLRPRFLSIEHYLLSSVIEVAHGESEIFLSLSRNIYT